MTPPGLAIDSQKIALVRGVIAASKEAGSSLSAQATDQPKFLYEWLNWLIEPPYSLFEATNSSPGCIRACMVRNSAAWPEATARAAVPPSNAAMRSSSTAFVGLVIRV